MSSLLQNAPVAKLRADIASLLGDTLGADPFRSARSRSPIFIGLRWGIGFAILFCGMPWLKFHETGPLFRLSLWGSCYFALAAALASSTSSAVSKVIEEQILPGLSERAAAAIDNDLILRFGRRRVSVVSLFVGALAAGATAEALHLDLQSSSMFEIGWLCCGYFVLYVTAARTTYIARFYGTFAAHSKMDSDRVYALDPAHSLQIARVASIAQRVLLFWFGILCLVATLVPLFQGLSHFLLFVVPTASFFSVIFGTIVFLKSESDIRSAVKERSESTLELAEREIADLFSRRGSLDALEWKRLRILTNLHDKLVVAGSYRSPLLSGLSLLVPLVGPVAAAAWPHLEPILKPLFSGSKP